MQLYGSLGGTLVWFFIGLGTAVLAFSQQNQVTGLIATGWLMLAMFSYLEYVKNKNQRNGDGERETDENDSQTV